VKNVDRLKHGSDSEIYEHDGTLKPIENDPVQRMLLKYDTSTGKHGLSLSDAWRMTQSKWDLFDIFGWFASKAEWFYLWILVQNNGTMSWSDIRDVYDDKLFRRIELMRRNQKVT
jgi:peroxygenase